MCRSPSKVFITAKQIQHINNNGNVTTTTTTNKEALERIRLTMVILTPHALNTDLILNGIVCHHTYTGDVLQC